MGLGAHISNKLIKNEYKSPLTRIQRHKKALSKIPRASCFKKVSTLIRQLPVNAYLCAIGFAFPSGSPLT
jgi:hypothetical protein